MGWLILCAGQSRRFGANKLVARIGPEHVVLSQVLQNLITTSEPVFAITRSTDDATANLLSDLSVDYGSCPDADAGMGHSLAWGVSQILSWSWCGVALGDMPYVTPATLKLLAKSASHNSIVIPVVNTGEGQEKWGHPVIFGQSYYPELQGLSGDQGARSLLKKHHCAVIRVPVADEGVLIDIDTPEDLENI